MKDKSISIIKTYMMIAVVLYHSMMFYTGTSWFTYIEPKGHFKIIELLAFFLNSFHVATFVAASGYLFFYKNYNSDKKKIIKKKIDRLILPFIFTTICWVLPFEMIFFKPNIKNIFLKFFLATSPRQLWFLLMLFWNFVVFAYVIKKIKFNKKTLLIMYFISSILGVAISKLTLDIFQIGNAIQYLLYFYFGGFLYHKKNYIEINKKIFMIVIIPIILLYPSYLLNISNSLFAKIIYHLIMPCIKCCEILIIFIIARKIAQFKINNTKINEILENNSFGIYLFHQQIIYVIITIINNKLNVITQITISLIISILLSIVICNILRKNKISKKMFGL